MIKLCFDFDWLLYEAACSVEERYIKVKHIPSKRKFEFKTATEFYGHWSKKNGGWIAEENLRNGKPLPKPQK